MKPEVVTIGLGYIGLPTSALIASHGTNVLGVDINQKVVDTINKGEIHIISQNAVLPKILYSGSKLAKISNIVNHMIYVYSKF